MKSVKPLLIRCEPIENDLELQGNVKPVGSMAVCVYVCVCHKGVTSCNSLNNVICPSKLLEFCTVQ